MLVGPGENAGVIDAGDGIAVAIRIESHNHPSAIEPYQGAATGVGGILRDIFTMGARPLAVMDPLFFGPLDRRPPALAHRGRGRRASRATATRSACRRSGGELTFDPCYAQNPLVNVLCLGALPVEPAWCSARPRARATWPSCSGSTTGRDGIGGVSVLASAGFAGDGRRRAGRRRQAAERAGGRPLRGEAADRGVPGPARRGAGGGHPGPRRAPAWPAPPARRRPGAGSGMDVDVTAVPRREEGMEPWEVMTSESQERMLAIVTPERLAGGGRGLPALGGPGHRRRPGHRPRVDEAAARSVGCGSATGSTARCWPTCRPPRWPTRPPSTTGPWPAPADLDAPGGRRPGSAPAAGATAARTCWPCWATPPGSTASTTTSSS